MNLGFKVLIVLKSVHFLTFFFYLLNLNETFFNALKKNLFKKQPREKALNIEVSFHDPQRNRTGRNYRDERSNNMNDNGRDDRQNRANNGVGGSNKIANNNFRGRGRGNGFGGGNGRGGGGRNHTNNDIKFDLTAESFPALGSR